MPCCSNQVIAKAGIGIELALDAAEILVQLTIDELKRGLYAHRAVVGLQHRLET